MSISPTRELSKFVVNTKYEDIPEETINNLLGIRAHILNALGVGLLGSTRWHGPKQLVEVLMSWGGREEAQVWGYNFKLPAVSAAMANSLATNALEYDDLDGHPGGPVVSTVLALAERRSSMGQRVNGKEFITAVTVGYEVTSRVSRAGGGLKGGGERGVYNSGTYNQFGAMAAAGRTLSLSIDEMVNCFGIGGCEAYGLFTASMTKRLHHARAARTGITAADLAQRGFTGTPDIMESNYGGFFQCFKPPELGGQVDLSWLTKGLGREFICSYNNIKMHASPGGDGVLDCAQELRTKYHIKVDQIDKIILEYPALSLDVHGGREWRSKDPADTITEVNAALMHEGYKISVMLMDGECTHRQYTEERFKDSATLDLIRKFKATDLTSDHLKQGIHTALTVIYEDGTRYVATSPPVKPYGHKERPPTRKQLCDKFIDCATQVEGIDTDRASMIIDVVDKIEDLKDASKLAELLAPII